MKRIQWGLIGLALCGIFVAAGVVKAADPIKVGPGIYTLKFENEKVRVSEILFKPGDKMPMHQHPDHFVYVLSAATMRLSYPDGKVNEISAVPGQVMWIPAETHAGANIGTTDFKALVVELKPLPEYTTD